MDSIIQKNDDRCFICGANGKQDKLDWHHIFGGAFRNKSEQYGLKVRICHNKCHIFGQQSVHQDIIVNRKIQRIGQRVAMDHYGWNMDKWMSEFGRNYLNEEHT